MGFFSKLLSFGEGRQVKEYEKTVQDIVVVIGHK